MANSFCKPISPIILPNAKAKFAKLIVKIVKNRSFNDFIYPFVSKKIKKLKNNKDAKRVNIFVVKTILENKIIVKSKNADTGNIG